MFKKTCMLLSSLTFRLGPRALGALGALGALAALAAGCADDGDPPPPPIQARYVIANEVYAADTTTSYVHVLDSLDGVVIDPSRALEFAGGRATIATINGWVFVAPPDRPAIIRHSIGADGALVADAELSFASYGFTSLWIDPWGNTFISPTKAYLQSPDDGTTIVWNPTTMEIEREIAPISDLVRTGKALNGSPAVVRGNRLFRTVFWSDWDAWQTSAEQYLAVFDVELDRMLQLIPETRCPGLSNWVDRDEAGNLYFSNWVWNVSETLVRGAPRSCALRITPDASQFDPGWSLPYAAVTDGREGAMYSYLAGGQGLLNVFHAERATYDGSSDPAELASSTNWRLWRVDAAARTGAPVDGLDWMTGGASTFHLGDRAFVAVPGADYAVTQLYEIVGGAAVPAFSIAGWSYQLYPL
jgi:hypothetical protein